jgi:uncharacterized membrane protein YfcA
MVGGMVLLWLMLLIMPVTTAIAVQGMLQLVANCSRAYFSRNWVDWRIIGFSTIGLAFAILLLVAIGYAPDIALVSLAVGLLPIFVWLPKSWIRLDASHPAQAVACGFASGSLNIGVGVAGPVVDIFFVRTDMDRRRILATKSALQVLSHMAKIAYYSASLAALSRTEIVSIGVAAPFAILGSMFGHRILQRMTNEGFRQGTRWLVTLVGAFYFLQGLWMVWSR